jgi:hypothetical protein
MNSNSNPLFLQASLQPTATVAYWAEAQLAGPRRWPLDGPCRRCAAKARPTRDHRAGCGQRTRRGAEFYGVAAGYRRQGLQLDHPMAPATSHYTET